MGDVKDGYISLFGSIIFFVGCVGGGFCDVYGFC